MYDMIGFGVGGGGFAALSSNESVDLGIVWDADLNYSTGDGEAVVFDLFGTPLGTVTQDLSYVEVEGSLGFGADINGIRPSAGLMFSGLFGTFSTPGLADGDIKGTNLAVYVGGDYAGEAAPVFATFRLLVGDISGFLVAGGVRF